MTRKSKREIERELESLIEMRDQEGAAKSSWDRHPEEVTDFVKEVCRDLLPHKHHNEIGNLDDPKRTIRYLKAVREDFGIETDRDGAVLSFLNERSEVDHSLGFTLAPLHGYEALPADERECCRQLMDEDEDAAATLLVRTAYEMWADAGSQMEVVR